MHWFLLTIGIVFEVVATTMLRLSDGFTRIGYGLIALASFGLAFYLMSIVVRTMPLGIAYSIWAGAGIAAVTAVGALVFEQELDGFAYLGIALIAAGVIVMNLLSTSATA